MKRKLLMFSVFLFSLIILTGCIPGDGTYSANDPAGFLWGIWHGWVAPISLIIGLFDQRINIYEVYNTGWWYDFAFYIAIISGFGGISIVRRKRSKRD